MDQNRWKGILKHIPHSEELGGVILMDMFLDFCMYSLDQILPSKHDTDRANLKMRNPPLRTHRPTLVMNKRRAAVGRGSVGKAGVAVVRPPAGKAGRRRLYHNAKKNLRRKKANTCAKPRPPPWRSPKPITEEEGASLLFPHASIHPRALRPWQARNLLDPPAPPKKQTTARKLLSSEDQIAARRSGSGRKRLRVERRWRGKLLLCSVLGPARDGLMANFYGAQGLAFPVLRPNSFAFFNRADTAN